jgi:peptidoglycan/xylan/chitin deacetylase (PgdA/CDA1 family)
MHLSGSLGWVWRSLRQDLRTHLQEVPTSRRLPEQVKRVSKYVLAAIFYWTGLTGILLRRVLRRSDACLILGFHGTTETSPHYFSRGHAIANIRDQVQYLKRYLRQVTLEEIALPVSRGESPPPATFAVTFDDGFANNVTLAIPVLRELETPATFFVPSGLVGSTGDLWVSSLRELVCHWRKSSIPEIPGLWPSLPVTEDADRYAAYFRMKEVLKTHNGRRQEVLDRLAQHAGGYIRPPEEDRVVDVHRLRLMIQPGFSVGAHTRTHPILSTLDPEQAHDEIEGSRRDLERALQRPVLDFAYPNGRFHDVNEIICRMVGEAGFRCAVTTEPGTVRRGDDRLALRRCMPGNVPAFLAAFGLLARVWAERRRAGDLPSPLARRVSYLAHRMAGYGS